mmetsp:Transcript_13229/g.27264  ORF Transcript_13229/g.27264 Transcript_13229/m.27264 type:complete len:230 (-) Transcript_13229:45-734(-)
MTEQLSRGEGGYLFSRDESWDGVESHHAALIRRIIPAIEKSEMKEVAGLRNTKSRFQSYKIECSIPPRGCHPLLQWSIWHRYSDFYKLRLRLIKQNSAIRRISFPPRRWFAGSCSPWVIRERKTGLKNFLVEAMKACCTDKEASMFDDFLEVKRHDKAPPTRRRSVEHTGLQDTDTIHHNSTSDLEWTKKIRRYDSSHNFNLLKQASDEQAKGQKGKEAAAKPSKDTSR